MWTELGLPTKSRQAASQCCVLDGHDGSKTHSLIARSRRQHSQNLVSKDICCSVFWQIKRLIIYFSTDLRSCLEIRPHGSRSRSHRIHVSVRFGGRFPDISFLQPAHLKTVWGKTLTQPQVSLVSKSPFVYLHWKIRILYLLDKERLFLICSTKNKVSDCILFFSMVSQVTMPDPCSSFQGLGIQKPNGWSN